MIVLKASTGRLFLIRLRSLSFICFSCLLLIRHHVLPRLFRFRPEVIAYNVYRVSVGIALQFFLLSFIGQWGIVLGHNKIIGQSQEDKDYQSAKHLEGQRTGEFTSCVLI